MKQRFYLFRRRGTYYLQDTRTGKQQSLETKARQIATRLLEAKRQTEADPGFNQFLLKICLSSSDPMRSREVQVARSLQRAVASAGRRSLVAMAASRRGFLLSPRHAPVRFWVACVQPEQYRPSIPWWQPFIWRYLVLTSWARYFPRPRRERPV